MRLTKFTPTCEVFAACSCRGTILTSQIIQLTKLTPTSEEIVPGKGNIVASQIAQFTKFIPTCEVITPGRCNILANSEHFQILQLTKFTPTWELIAPGRGNILAVTKYHCWRNLHPPVKWLPRVEATFWQWPNIAVDEIYTHLWGDCPW
jgi:hypothetical protein